MKNVSVRMLVAAVAGLGLALSTSSMASAQEGGAQYTVTFTGMWTPASHPFEYPKPGLLTGPHLSGLIGCSHAGQYEIFKEGALPTSGLENLSENGKHSPLDAEIKAAIKAGKAGALVETDPIRDMSKTQMAEIHLTDQFPMVSAVAMVAPSPDWFAGVADVNLKENGTWVASKTVELYAYDSGGDDGTTYAAADEDTNPKKPTTVLKDAHFVINDQRSPVAMLTFTKK